MLPESPSGKAGPEQAWEMDVTEEPLIKTINDWQFSRVANDFSMEQLPPHLKEEVSSRSELAWTVSANDLRASWMH